MEQNYRSTGSILRASLAIVEEGKHIPRKFIAIRLSFFSLRVDKKRIPKSLHTSHPLGPTPFLLSSENEKQEADFIAFEIKRSVAHMGGVLKWGDFAILCKLGVLYHCAHVDNS